MHTGSLNKPPTVLLAAITKLRAQARRKGYSIRTQIDHMLKLYPAMRLEYDTPASEKDQLLEEGYIHQKKDEDCTHCAVENLIERRPRVPPDPVVHYGLIGSANQLMRDAVTRERLRRENGILCFEMEAAGLMNDFPCLVIRGISDYADSHKRKEWQGYASATSAAFAKELLIHVSDTQISQATDAASVLKYQKNREQKVNYFLQALYTCPYAECKDRNRKLVRGTCKWFIEHPLFNNWRDNKQSNVLWVSADPGCGKSVLARYLIDKVLLSDSKTICYFFFKDDFPNQRSSASAICSLLRQLFSQKPALLKDSVLREFERSGNRFVQSFSGLWYILTSAAARYVGDIICVLDALDECQESDREDLISAIGDLYSTEGRKPTTPTIKFLVTSRSYDNIRRGFRKLETRMPTIHLSGEAENEVKKISQEINLVIQSRVQEIGIEKSLQPDECALLLKQLTLVPNRTYLWVYLTLDIIQKTPGFTKGNIRRVLKELPKTVDEAYEKILERSLDEKKARKLLHIVIAAQQPLCSMQMSLALAIEENHRSYQTLLT